MANRAIDLTGKRYGKLVVLERDYDYNGKPNTAYWKCLCDCGNVTTKTSAHLRSGNSKSCGCVRFNDLTGRIFGRWNVIEKAGKYQRLQLYRCVCSCGNEGIILGCNLTSGASQSCGCLQKELARDRFTSHGMRNSRIYTIYYNMKARCYNPSNKSYKNYGGRGIVMCPEWTDSFESFKEWAIANGYSDEFSIDRIDVNGIYEPNNCRWATAEEQDNNQQKTIFVEIAGQRKSLKQWINLMGWKYSKHSARHRRGADIFTAEEIHIIESKLKE